MKRTGRKKLKEEGKGRASESGESCFLALRGDGRLCTEVSVKVVDADHESRGHVEMAATTSVTSLRQTRSCRSNGI